METWLIAIWSFYIGVYAGAAFMSWLSASRERERMVLCRLERYSENFDGAA